MLLDRPPFENFEPGDFPTRSQFDLVEPKKDGWWGQLLLNGLEWELWSRSGALKKFGDLVTPVELTLLHGEYIYGTEWAKDQSMYDSICVFDAVSVDGVDTGGMPLSETREIINEFLPRIEKEDIREGVRLIEQWPIEESPRIWDELVVGQKYEGLVFKNSTGSFGSTMGRMKQVASMDYICLGFEDSESERYIGTGVAAVVGGLYYGDDDEPIQACKVSGLTDEQRIEFYNNREKYIGKVFEASGKKVSKRGALRHPSFEGWRDDKKPEECVW